jgi:hypothetical protein
VRGTYLPTYSRTADQCRYGHSGDGCSVHCRRSRRRLPPHCKRRRSCRRTSTSATL